MNPPREIDLRHVISIRQPWAFLIIRPDLSAGSAERAGWMLSTHRKDIENRKSRTAYRGPLYIHVPQTFDFEGYHALRDNADLAIRNVLRRALPGEEWNQAGGIIGRVTVTDCVLTHTSDWKMDGSAGLVLAEPEILPWEKMRGMPGIFRPCDLPLTKAEKAALT